MKSRRITPDDPLYPADMMLVELVAESWARPAPPLYLRGRLPPGRGVAIVGTRHPCEAARAFAHELARVVAQAGWCVWSGGAKGIDGAAHEGALCAPGMTVVVTAGGLDSCYPAQHAALYQRVVEAGGGLLSLQPDGARRRMHHFLWRNTVMAALSLATIVVEAPAKSGTHHTVSAARRLARPLLVVPQAPWSSGGAGNTRVLIDGAVAVGSVEHALVELERVTRGGWSGPKPAPRPAPGAAAAQLALPGTDAAKPQPAARAPTLALDEDAHAVLAALTDEPSYLDALCQQTGLSAGSVSAALLLLRIAGFSTEDPPGGHRRVGCDVSDPV